MLKNEYSTLFTWQRWYVVCDITDTETGQSTRAELFQSLSEKVADQIKELLTRAYEEGLEHSHVNEQMKTNGQKG